MREYRIYGADRETGIDRQVNLVAADRLDAEYRASERDILVHRVVEIPSIAKHEIARVLPVRLWAAMISGLGMLGTFLPWISIPIIGTLNGTRGDGWISFGAFAIMVLVSLSPRPSARIHPGRRIILVVLGLGCAGLGAWKVYDFVQIRDAYAAKNGIVADFSQLMDIGVGLWVIVGCGITVAVISTTLSRSK